MKEKEYIESMGLDHLTWFKYPKTFPYDVEDSANYGHCFILKYHKADDQFWVTIGRISADNFMEHDDLSWVGPVRNVVAFAPFEAVSTIKGLI